MQNTSNQQFIARKYFAASGIAAKENIYTKREMQRKQFNGFDVIALTQAKINWICYYYFFNQSEKKNSRLK